MLQMETFKFLTYTFFRCQKCVKISSKFIPKQKSHKLFFQSNAHLFQLAIIWFFFLIALSCFVPTVGAKTTTPVHSLATTNSTSINENQSLSNDKPSGLQTLPQLRVQRVLRRKKRKSVNKLRRHKKRKSMKPRKVRKRKTKGKRRKRCKKKRCKNRRKNKKNQKHKKQNKNKISSSTLGDVGSKIRRIYSKSGNSFHLAVLQNGTVRGEASHKQSDFS